MEVRLSKKFMYQVQVGDDLNSLCEKFNSEKDNIKRNNPLIALYPGEWIEICVNEFLTHIVKPAQSLREISEIYGISEEKIIQENNLNSSKVFIGQRLKIPAKKKHQNKLVF